MECKIMRQAQSVRKFAALLLFVFAGLSRVCASETTDEEQKQVGSQFVWFPLVFSSPETGFGAGGTTIMTFRQSEDVNPGSLSAVAFYTQEEQYLLALTRVSYAGSAKTKFIATGALSHFPSKFYGIGSHTSASQEEEYTLRTLTLKPSVLFRIASGFRAGPFLDVKVIDVLEIADDGLLASGRYQGTEDHVLSGGGLVAEYDTRDNVFYPGKGSFHRFSAGLYRDWMGSDYKYEAYELDLRKYLPVRRDRILAFQFQANTVHGDVPFEEYATLQNMRGVESTRYRDLNSFSLQTEYRVPFSGKWTGAVFASAGNVLENGGDLRFSGLKPAAGFGARYTLNKEEKINFRFDLGFSEDGGKVYFRLLEAF